MILESTLKAYQSEIDEGIGLYMPSPNAEPAILHEAMLYSMQAGGKRLRPILVLLAHKLFPSKWDPMPAAVAIECLHTYSLIHDDLPCMDDSELRRGLPTCHKKFGEAMALLAGDALLTYSFELISREYASDPALANQLIRDLAVASGSRKLIGGQVEDLRNTSTAPDVQKLLFIHENKTAALLTVALKIGLLLGSPPEGKLELLDDLGHHMGMAFQIIDDVLDVTSDDATLGKASGKDADNGTLTYPTVYGLEASHKKAIEHSEKAVQLAQDIGGDNETLIALIGSLAHRLS